MTTPLQEKPQIFAYLRRSTSKDEQKESLLQQEEGIVRITKGLGINLSEVHSFMETKSGFENRTRPKWKEMIKEIDKCKTPCILLCRDTSRLSRNPNDNLVIANRIFGDNKTKKTIGYIYFLGDNALLQEWSERSDKKYIVDKLHQNYTESLETKTKSVNGHILKLDIGTYPYHPAPRGLEHTIVGGKKILKQNAQIEFVRRAFEMKAEKYGHKAICAYLEENGIFISPKEITPRYFTNTVYIGKYTERNTKKVFDNLIFLEGKTPISQSLWLKVQNSLAKRGRICRPAEERDIIEEKLKVDDGSIDGAMMCRDIKKGKHTYYKNTKHKINIAQKKILDAMMKELFEECIFQDESFFHPDAYVISGTYREEANKLYDELKAQKVSPQEIRRELDKRGYLEGGREAIAEIVMENRKNHFLNAIKDFVGVQNKGVELVKKAEIKKLKVEKEKYELERKTIVKNGLLKGYEQSFLEETLGDIDIAIASFDEKIAEFSETTELDKYIERLPQVIEKIVELSKKALSNEDFKSIKADLLKLYEISVSNSKISTKKELKIKLFEVLRYWSHTGCTLLEAPAGVEPASRALQAPV